MLFDFLWKHRRHYIKKSVVINSYDHGGLSFLDFSSLNTFKINWLRQFLNGPDSFWNAIPNYVFSKVGGLPFLLVCNYNFSKPEPILPIRRIRTLRRAPETPGGPLALKYVLILVLFFNFGQRF